MKSTTPELRRQLLPAFSPARLLLVAIFFLALSSLGAGLQGLSVGKYQLTGSRQINGNEFELTYKASLINTGPALRNVTARLVPSSTGPTIVDGLLNFGNVRARGTVASSDTFSIRVILPSSAFDTRTLRWTIVSDTPSPPGFAVSITSPADGLLANVANVQVRGSALTPPSSVVVNGVVATLNGRNFSAPVTLREGNNSLTAVATDGFGTVATASINATLDTTPPRLSIDSPHEGAVLSEPRVSVSGAINDTVVGTINAAQATVTVNGAPAMVANRTYVAMNVPLVPGVNTLTSTGKDPVGNAKSVSIKVTYNPTQNAHVESVSGDGQSAPIGQLVAQPLVVRALDGGGQPTANRKVIFKVVQNDGSVSSDQDTGRSLIVMTGPDGRAQVHFRLGNRAGACNNQVSANIVGLEGEAMFCASATPAAPGLLVPDAGNNQVGVVGQPLPSPLISIVVDSGRNRLPNIPITYSVKSGGGSFGGQPSLTVNTDSDGRALAALSLGALAGNDNNVVEANFAGNPGVPVRFVASGRVPGNPAETSISGVVLDNSDIPVPGATLRIVGFPQAVRSDANGFFKIKPAPVGALRLIADGATVTRPGTWVWLQFNLVTIAGQDNDVGRPVRLLPIDVAHGLRVDATHGGTLTLPQVPGYSLNIAPGSVLFPDGTHSGVVSVTVVHPDKMPDPPSFGQQPRFLVSIQPANAIFNPPAAMCIPNLDGLPPGQKTDMYSYDHDMERFVSIGTGTVSEDGTTLCTDPGVGVIKAGWHCGGNPASVAAGITSTVSVDKSTLELAIDETATVNAVGSPVPPHAAPFEWRKTFSGIPPDEQGDVDFSTQGGGNQSTATVKGTKSGRVNLEVRYRCKSAQWSAYKVVAITVKAEDGGVIVTAIRPVTVPARPAGVVGRLYPAGTPGIGGPTDAQIVFDVSVSTPGSLGSFIITAVNALGILPAGATVAGSPGFTMATMTPADKQWMTLLFLSLSANPEPPLEFPEGFSYDVNLHRMVNELRFLYAIKAGKFATFTQKANQRVVGNTPFFLPGGVFYVQTTVNVPLIGPVTTALPLPSLGSILALPPVSGNLITPPSGLLGGTGSSFVENDLYTRAGPILQTYENAILGFKAPSFFGEARFDANGAMTDFNPVLGHSPSHTWPSHYTYRWDRMAKKYVNRVSHLQTSPSGPFPGFITPTGPVPSPTHKAPLVP